VDDPFHARSYDCMLKLTVAEYDRACRETLLSFHQMEVAAGHCEPITVKTACGAKLTVALPPLFTTGFTTDIDDGDSDSEVEESDDESGTASSVEESSEDDVSESSEEEEGSAESDPADEDEELAEMRIFVEYHLFRGYLWFSDRDIDTVRADTPAGPRLLRHPSVIEKLRGVRIDADHAQRYLAIIQPGSTSR
jgi:hypothetical protein